MKYILNANQLKFFKERSEQKLALISGLGGGKSFALQLAFLVNEVLQFPDAKHCMAALSYRQLHDTTIPGLERFLEEMEVPFHWEASNSQFIVNGSTEVLLRSQETADKMRSVEIGSLYIEEGAYWKKKAFLTFLGRLRDKKGSRRMRTVTTPNEMNWFYKYFIKDKRGKVFYTSTYDNKHLPDDYIELLETSYDDMMIEQELKGNFVSLAGMKRYYSFDENIHVKPQLKDVEALWKVGMDFNVNPLTACYGYVEDDILHIVGEMWLNHSNTYDAADKLIEIFEGPEGVEIAPDATGKARKTSAVKSDHQILRDAGFEVMRVKNPPRKDRFSCVNGLLRHKRIEIDPSCVHLIEDLKTCSGETRDDDEEMTGHISDALGYLCWKLFPIRKSIGEYATEIS
jgi:hypothetical protein